MKLLPKFFAAACSLIFALLGAYWLANLDAAQFKDQEVHALIENDHSVEILKDRITRLFYAFSLSLRNMGRLLEIRSFSERELQNMFIIAALGNDDIAAFALKEPAEPMGEIGRLRLYPDYSTSDLSLKNYIYELTLSDGRRLQLYIEPDFLAKEMYFARFQGETNLALKDSVYGNFLGGSEQALKNPGNILTVSFEGGSVDIYSEFAPKVYKFSLLNMRAPTYFLLFALSIFFYIALRRAQNAIHKNAVYKDIFDSAYSGLVLINPKNGEISLINTRGELTLGYAAWNKAKNSFFSHIAEGHREKIIRELNSSDCVRYQHVIINCSDGREIWAVIFIKRLSEQAALVCFADVDSYARDYLFSQKELGIAYFILNSFPSAFFLTDEKAEIIKANISAQIMLGLTSEEILGRTCKELFPSPFGEEMFKNDLEILSGAAKYYAGECSLSVRGQAEKSYRINKIPYLGADGCILGVLSIFDDITESVLKEPAAKAAAEARHNALAASGASYSFFLNNSAERKRLERFHTIRLAGLGNIFKYLNDCADTLCNEIIAETGKVNIPKENFNTIVSAARQIIDLSFMERLFRFNESPKVFSPNAMIKAILSRTGINAELTEDDVSKLTMLEAYPTEVEEVFTKLMERLAELCGGFNISLSADSLEYKFIFSFNGKRVSETLDKDIIFLYSWLFIKEILAQTWETEESAITITFAL